MGDYSLLNIKQFKQGLQSSKDYYDRIYAGNNLKIFNTFTDLINDTDIKLNDLCITLGKNVIGDGLDAKYLITSNEADCINFLTQTGLTATLQIENNEINIGHTNIRIGENNQTAKDNNAAILKELVQKYATQGYIIRFIRGEYHISDIQLDGLPKNATITFKGTGSGENYQAIKNHIYVDKNFLLDTSCTDNLQVNLELFFIINNNENYEERGVCIGSDTASEFNFHLKDVYINGFEYGVKSHQWSCGGSGGENITFSNCLYGIYLPATSHGFKVDGLNLHFNMTGIYTGNGGRNFTLKNVSYSPGFAWNTRDNYDKYYGITPAAGVIIDGAYLEDYVGAPYNPDRSIFINTTGNTVINNVPFQNYSGMAGELVLRYAPNSHTGKKNSIYINNCKLDSTCLEVMEFTANEEVQGIVVDNKDLFFCKDYCLYNTRPLEYDIKKAKSLQNGSLTDKDGSTINVYVYKWSTNDNIYYCKNPGNPAEHEESLITIGNKASSIGSIAKINFTVKNEGLPEGTHRIFLGDNEFKMNVGTDGIGYLNEEFMVNNLDGESNKLYNLAFDRATLSLSQVQSMKVKLKIEYIDTTV